MAAAFLILGVGLGISTLGNKWIRMSVHDILKVIKKAYFLISFIRKRFLIEIIQNIEWNLFLKNANDKQNYLYQNME